MELEEAGGAVSLQDFTEEVRVKEFAFLKRLPK